MLDSVHTRWRLCVCVFVCLFVCVFVCNETSKNTYLINFERQPKSYIKVLHET